jgi:hypothetical protein
MSLVPKKPAFLAAFAACGSITTAAAAVGIDRSMHYRWMREDAEYETAFKQAVEEAAGFLEDVAVERGTVGWDEPVIYKGELATRPVLDERGAPIYVPRYDENGDPLFTEGGDPLMAILYEPLTVRKKSDALLQTVLKAWLPKKYRDNHHVEAEVTHAGLGDLTDAQLEHIARGGSAGAAPPADSSE